MFSENFKKLRENQGVSNYKIESLVGIPRSTLSTIESGRLNPSDEVLRKLASVPELQTTYDELKSWVLLDKESPGAIIEAAVLLNSDFRQIKLPNETYRVPCLGKVAAGGFQLAEQDQDTVYYAWDWLPDGEKCFCLEVVGDSMEPDIKNGSIVLVSEVPHIYPGGTYVIQTSDYEATLKYIKVSDNGLYLIPANPAHKPIELEFSNVDKIFEVHEVRHRPEKGKRQ